VVHTPGVVQRTVSTSITPLQAGVGADVGAGVGTPAAYVGEADDGSIVGSAVVGFAVVGAAVDAVGLCVGAGVGTPAA
jgi:hypothetical protein